MTFNFHLLPVPRSIELSPAAFDLAAERLVYLASDPQALRFAASRFQDALRSRFHCDWQTTASWATPPAMVGLTLRLTPDEIPHPHGYLLAVTRDGITIQGHDTAGVFYGVCTLNQLLVQLDSPTLPCLRIADWPDILQRGAMLDISRDKVYTQQTLYELVDLLASWKINQLQLYTEHTFAYRRHPKVWANASPMTGQELLALDAYCRERHVELVPNQNTFGHLHRWLIHDDYAQLAEIHQPFPVPWGTHPGPFSLAPEHPGSIALVREMLDELLPHFTSRIFNAGADETHDIGHGQSQAIVAQLGQGRVYLNFLLKLYAEVSRRGFTMQFWADIVNQHPELVPEIPRDVTGLCWGYEADHPFDVEAARFAAASLPFYVCPGTSAWNSLAGRTDNALGNLLNAAENGIRHGAAGYLITDWGDNGHWQVLPVSYLGFAAGAAFSWCLAANRGMTLPPALSLHAFQDPSGVMGRLAYDLGNVYAASPVQFPNGAVLFGALQYPLQTISTRVNPGLALHGVSPPASVDAAAEPFERSLSALEEVAPLLGSDAMARPDAGLVRREFANTIRLMRYACQRGLLAVGARPDLAPPLQTDLPEIITEYKQLWLARNRPGGLTDSVARFHQALSDTV
ncbi:MAG TPA: glycoside hydrolase family 20 zincin-like fold domain-containing protein [Levilinea sp.]|nr:glycoside hydrolase family 20 zincin-like fold domain-containing protein [Levilinea sp.]